jgi:hypothetical protein
VTNVEPLELILVLLIVGVIVYAALRGGRYRRAPRARYRRGARVRSRRLF